MTWLSDREMARVEHAENIEFKSPVPTRIISNGEFTPPPQSENQKRVEAKLKDLADLRSRKLGVDRRTFLKSSAGMATAFLAMNEVYGELFDVSDARAADLGAPAARAKKLEDQFIIDAQTHFVRDDFNDPEILFFLKNPIKYNWNPNLLKDIGVTVERYKFENYLKEIYLDSDTKVSVLSGAGSDLPGWIVLTNDQMAGARRVVNEIAGARRMLAHAWFEPGRPGWLDAVDHAITLKPESWKGYTIGDPRRPAKYPWRLDDEKLLYPFYEKIQKAGINTVCVHKGLLPDDYLTLYKDSWKSATVEDVGKAAKDWPGINFVIYHAAMRAPGASGYSAIDGKEIHEADAGSAGGAFDRDGYIQWTSDLAAIPEEFGVSNVYAEVGGTFGASCVARPKFCAGFIGTLIKGMGADHVIWGTDSVWAGSPQWQIEAFRRLEIPEEYQKKFGFKPLGPADGLVKNAIFGLNSARMYELDVEAIRGPITRDNIKKMRGVYQAMGTDPSNTAYGYVDKKS